LTLTVLGATALFANSALGQSEQNITFWGRFYASNAARALNNPFHFLHSASVQSTERRRL
jgi:hypothetical protein